MAVYSHPFNCASFTERVLFAEQMPSLLAQLPKPQLLLQPSSLPPFRLLLAVRLLSLLAVLVQLLSHCYVYSGHLCLLLDVAVMPSCVDAVIKATAVY